MICPPRPSRLPVSTLSRPHERFSAAPRPAARFSFGRYGLRALALAGLTLAAACAGPPAPNAGPSAEDITRFKAWRTDAPAYRFYPGDTLALDVLGAPELSREDVLVGPDGRASAPLVGAVMVAGRTPEEAAEAFTGAFQWELREPDVLVRPVAFGSQQVFVGGEVAQPGAYPLPGPIGVLEAVTLAGGFTDRGRARQVVVVRRAPDGGAMLRVVDAKAGVMDARALDPIALQRFDVVFVPKTTITEVNTFIDQYVMEALPFQFGFFYDLNTGG